jgi:transformation/transcription domain-associated protein
VTQVNSALFEASFFPDFFSFFCSTMDLALTAKDPYNYFLLLRALFRSIGGGSHDRLNQEFLPLLPSLLQGLF